MIEIRTISTPREIERFIDFRTALYRDDPCAVPYLFKDEKDTLLPSSNPAFEFCDAEYYMAYRDGRPVGRVAAIINRNANGKWGKKNVRFGYFDFIDDMEVSAALIEKVREYGRKHGMDTIIGPMGFTDLDREGMLIEGFDVMATMHANHNYAYYQKHVEALGFTKDNDWVQQLVKIPEQVPEKFSKITSLIAKRYHILPRKLSKRDLLYGGYGRRFFHILNDCYKDLYEFSALSEAQIDKLIKEYLALADLNLVTFIFDENIKSDDPTQQMIGFGVSFPSFSKALRRTGNGRLLPMGWLHIMRTLLFHDTETVDLLLIGVLPEYRSKGANALAFDDLIRWYHKYKFKYALTLAMMETNDGVLSAWQYFEARTVKRLRSYKAAL
ncbi:MAG: N-acetyltransferase [Prevotella sp.]|nr:N-acetyltransferase [Prevotella sp.]